MHIKALRLLQKCLKNKEEVLDLSDCGLDAHALSHDTPIDMILRKCTHVRVLILNRNFRADYRSEYWNSITHLPSAISELRNLEELYAVGNQAKGRIGDLGVLQDLKHLRMLDLSGNAIDDIESLLGLRNLTHLVLQKNDIWHLSGMQKLEKLEYLNLDKNEIRDLIPLSGLPFLKVLHADNNKIDGLAGFGALPELELLDLSYNNIRSLERMSGFDKLKKLVLAHNKISEINYPGHFPELEELDLSYNHIAELPGLDGFTMLKKANFSNNRITILKDLGNPPALRELDVSHNWIVQVEPSSILTNKIGLFLGHNRLQTISRDAYSVFFARTDPGVYEWLLKWQDAHPGAAVPGDMDLDLELFKITRKMQEGEEVTDQDLKALHVLFLCFHLLPNPLSGLPMQVIRQGIAATLHYLEESERTGTENLYEAKMLIVGQPRAGKTSLRFKLVDVNSTLPIEDMTTRGIDILLLEFDFIDETGKHRPFSYNVWDFGGQQIYQTTHQFFLTHRSLYVLVVDSARDGIGNEDAAVNYWLQAVELLGGNSPMLLLKNIKAGRDIDIDLSKKRERFDFLGKDYTIDLDGLIHGSNKYNARDVREFNRLRDDIEHELRHLPLVGFKMPRDWVRIRKDLQELSLKRPYISKQDYMELCQRSGVNGYDVQMELSGIFHDLGVFLHFQDHPGLDEFIILQNVWATDAVFAVLDHPGVRENSGTFTEGDLLGIWEEKGYMKEVHRKLLALMMRFEMCYHFGKGKEARFIVPEMLPRDPPKNYSWKQDNDLVLFYKYDFMPKGLLTRLIVRLHRHINRVENEEIVWKTTVQIDGDSLYCPNTLAEIREAWDNKQLFVKVHGSNRKNLMDKISHEIDLLNNEYFGRIDNSDSKKKSKWYKMIPCSCPVCRDSNEKHFYDYTTLLRAKEKGKPIQCQLSFEDVEVQKLLDGIFVEDKKAKPGTSEKKLFISFAQEDLALVNDFITHLAALKSDRKVTTWHCTQLIAGQSWDAEIKKEFFEADIVCFMISPNFMNSRYIQKYEVQWAFDRIAKDTRFRIVPIILESCRWTTKENDLMQFTALPYWSKPVTGFKNQNIAWLIVTECLEIMIKEADAPRGYDFYNSNVLTKKVQKLLEQLVKDQLDA
jgi:internalin A